MSWKLQDAKNRFSELVESALKGIPQLVTRHGKNVVVVVSYDSYQKNTVKKKQKKLSEFFTTSPLAKVKLDLKRSADTGREEDVFD